MKFHRTLVQAVVSSLQQIFNEGAYADKVVEQTLKQNPKWGARDRRFIAETIYEMVRWRRMLSLTLSEGEGTDSLHYYRLFGTWQILQEEDLPPWEEFNGMDKGKILIKFNEIKQIRKYRESIPDWLDELGSKELGDEVWEKEIAALNKEANVILRANTLKISAEALQEKLGKKGIETKRAGEDGLILRKRQNVYQSEEFKQGLFEIQDASSQLVAPFLKVEPGMTVIDACAGAGGKSLHIAALMKNTGKIISMDVEERKLTELKKRAERAGVYIIQTQLVNESVINELSGSADRLLLDVPCSGLGVLRRTPDAKWKLTPDFIKEVRKTQQQIIYNYSKMLKPGGLLVYATCSILPGENQLQVNRFLKSNEGKFKMMNERKVFPSEGFDGFYMCVLEKNGE